MHSDRVYRKSPIKEALIDFSVEFAEPPPMMELQAIHEIEKVRYPEVEPRSYFQGTFTFGAMVAAATEQTVAGFIGWSPNRDQAFQARIDGFTFSRMRPYPHWPEVVAEAERLFDVYRERLPAGNVKRCAVRFINQIEFEQSPIDLDQYFLTGPRIPPDLDTGFAAMLLQLHFPDPDPSNTLILNIASVPPEDLSNHAIVLDLDAFKFGDFKTDEDIWSTVDQLHARIKTAFEASITDKLREQFG